MTTYRDLMKSAAARLHAAGIDDAAYDARALMLSVTGLSFTDLLLRQDEEIPVDAHEDYVNMIRQRSDRIPLQHLTGTQWFYGLEFLVNEDVLIPRPETEMLIEAVLEYAGAMMKTSAVRDDVPVDRPDVRGSRGHTGVEYAAEPFEILDMCTGSGCILLTLLHELCGVRGTGVDFSAEALDVAQENAKRLGLAADSAVLTDSSVPKDLTGYTVDKGNLTDCRISWLQSDMFENVIGRYDLIVSNPPYICRQDIGSLAPEVRDHDPRMALDGGEDGLDFYRILAAEAPAHLKPGGRMILEIGADQALSVTGLLRQAGYSDIAVRQDLAGLDRVVEADWKL